MRTNKRVLERIDQLILDDGYTAYNKLPDDACAELSALSMISNDNTAVEAICESERFHIAISRLITFMVSGSNESAIGLAEALRENAVSYLERGLAELFDERVGELECERKREGGLHPIVDRINGEIRWIR